jgi:hypothetical protein
VSVSICGGLIFGGGLYSGEAYIRGGGLYSGGGAYIRGGLYSGGAYSRRFTVEGNVYLHPYGIALHIINLLAASKSASLIINKLARRN